MRTARNSLSYWEAIVVQGRGGVQDHFGANQPARGDCEGGAQFAWPASKFGGVANFAWLGIRQGVELGKFREVAENGKFETLLPQPLNYAERTGFTVGALVVRTADFRLAYCLMRELKRLHISFYQIPANSPLPRECSVWFGSAEEVATSKIGNGVACDYPDVTVAIERALHLSNTRETAQILSFGIDPGPRPGLAWLADGKPLGVEQMEGVDETVDRICRLVALIPHRRAVVRIGDGAPTVGTRLSNICLARGLDVERVDERRTSVGTPRHQHHHSAARIARMAGESVTSRTPVRPTRGEVKEIQRRSRGESEGRLTLPHELAQAVAVGRLSMVEALDEQRRR